MIIKSYQKHDGYMIGEISVVPIIHTNVTETGKHLEISRTNSFLVENFKWFVRVWNVDFTPHKGPKVGVFLCPFKANAAERWFVYHDEENSGVPL